MRSVLITGAASGIGAATARRFAAEGAGVLVADLPGTAGQQIADEIGGVFVPTDVTVPEQNEAAMRAAVDAFGGLNVVYLNAGVSGGINDLEAYRRVMSVNIDGTVFGIHAALPALVATGGGTIVVSSSLAGVSPWPLGPVYSTTKHAVVGMVRSSAPTLLARNITINAVCPGLVDTPLLGELREYAIANDIPLATTAEVADAVYSIAEGAGTGEAWLVPPGGQPRTVRFPEIDLADTIS